MAKFTFRCEECGNSLVKITGRTTEVKCDCGKIMSKSFPKISTSNKTEIVDKYQNLAQRPTQAEEIQERRDKYYWEVEVPRLVNSGTYETKTMLENGWIYLDDHNHVQIQNVPPSKRKNVQ